MTPTEQDKELFNYLEKISEYNKLGGKGHGNFEDTCYICGISPSNLMELITSLIKELVAEAKPNKKHVGDEVAENRSYTGERLFNATIDEYHSNLLKALEEV